jgi:RNA polymerase sigma-70 factor (ECF subfamily)
MLIGLNDRTSLTISSKDQTPEEKLFSDERTNELLSAIESLSETQKIAYTMYNMEDFSYKEIAEIMQISLSSVESLIFRAKKNLKSKLEIYFKNNEL